MTQQIIQLWIGKWRSLIEIILLSVGIYYGYLYFRGTRGAKVLTGLAIVFLTLTLISQLLNLVVIGWIIRSFSVFLAVALVVIFQPELRRGLAELGGHPIFSLTSEKRETVHDIAEAVTQLANKQFGALIAIERDTSIRVYEETGVIIDSIFSVELLLTLFHPKAALHDGGVIEASVCGIAQAWESLRNPMRSRWSFRKRPAAFRSATGAGSSAILIRKHSESVLARFSCKALMKKLILNNWRAKLISLLLATTLWYLIKKNVATTPSLSDEPGGQSTLTEKR
jgi:DNA integrity scanning protein DisA with diadenylate cyclase activity